MYRLASRQTWTETGDPTSRDKKGLEYFHAALVKDGVRENRAGLDSRCALSDVLI